jgi:hypothetical protein
VAKRGPAGRDGDEPRDADPSAPSAPGSASDDRVTAAADELYSADSGEFTDRRKALAEAARAAGDTAAAKRIAALRKPTRAAWVVNQLARADPGAPDRLAELAAALREAEQAKDGPRLRELSAARGPLVDSLTAQALSAAGVADPPAGLREEVTETLTSAIADPEVAAEFAAGTLTRAAQWAGFGLASFGDTPFGATDEGAPTRRHLHAVPSPEVSAPAPAPARAGARRAAPGRVSEEEQARRARAEEQRLAEEAAQRAAHRRQAFEDAERMVASTAATAAEAGAAEDQLEAEVRDLEQRLTRAREDLASARMRARRAESAARRARQSLDRLPGPE